MSVALIFNTIIPSTVALAVPFYKKIYYYMRAITIRVFNWINGCLCSKYDLQFRPLIAKLWNGLFFIISLFFPRFVTTAMAWEFRKKVRDYNGNGCSCYYGYLNLCLRSVFLKMIWVKDPLLSDFTRREPEPCRYRNCLRIWSSWSVMVSQSAK